MIQREQCFVLIEKEIQSLKESIDRMSVVLENKPENKLQYKVAQPKSPKKPSMGIGGSIKDFSCDKCGKKLDRLACISGGCLRYGSNKFSSYEYKVASDFIVSDLF